MDPIQTAADNGFEAYQKGDYDTAVKWFRMAADQGHLGAQTNLGVCYKYGRGVEKDEAKGVELYRKAAEQGYANAQKNMGSSYYDGTGVAQDYVEAAKWYRLAAEQGKRKPKTAWDPSITTGRAWNRITPRVSSGSAWQKLKATWSPRSIWE